MWRIPVVAGLSCLLAGSVLAAQPTIVAAEAAYADIARQVAGPDARVAALLSNPATDPHEFEPTPTAARAVADAGITIANGLGYDPWMARLVAASGRPGVAITVADLLHRRDGDNPHLWYDPAAMPALAAALASALRAADPAHDPGYLARRDQVLASLAALRSRIVRMRGRVAGAACAATEPVFGLMAAALGFSDRHARFELSQMNGTEPRASDVAALQDDLRGRRVRLLFVNAQRQGPAIAQLVAMARSAGIPVVQVAESLPPGQTYEAWIGGTLDRVQAALGSS